MELKKNYLNGYHRWKLRDWIPFEKLDLKTLLFNLERFAIILIYLMAKNQREQMSLENTLSSHLVR